MQTFEMVQNSDTTMLLDVLTKYQAKCIIASALWNAYMLYC